MGRQPCFLCKHFKERAEYENGSLGKCDAYPKGIPFEFYIYMHHSDRPKECNNGIGFESEENKNEF